MATESYPKPRAHGGRLIRKVIAFVREAQMVLPLEGPVIIAVSGGADSKALALLFARYGRRLLRSPPILAHVDHGWRKEAQVEQAEVVAFARRLGLECETVVLPKPEAGSGRSWEEQARALRYDWLEQVRQTRSAQWILTAHHQGDLAESVLWALCTGQAQRRGGGIRVSDPPLLRPFLGVPKSDLVAFLREEGEPWAEDASNTDPRFLRAQIRTQVLPALVAVFPQAAAHLAELGLRAQQKGGRPQDLGENGTDAPLSALLFDRGIRLRSKQWSQILQSGEKGTNLPLGWRIRREKTCHRTGNGQIDSERWVLEKEAQAD